MAVDTACCAPNKATFTGVCPVSGTRGTSVKLLTVAAQIKGPLPPQQEFWLCEEPDCEVVYFGSHGATFTVADLHVEPGFKNPSDGLLCYCFEHRRSDFEREILETGTTEIPNAIRALTRDGSCACEVRNPSGRCCLGDVRRFVDEIASVVSPSRR